MPTRKLFVLDTPQLAALAKGWSSEGETARAEVERFMAQLQKAETTLLLSYHHLEEILQHENDDVVAQRIAFLETLPEVAWVRQADGGAGLGSIADILAAEAVAALDRENVSAQAVARAARAAALTDGSGLEALAAYKAIWRELSYLARKRAAESRALEALTSNSTAKMPRIRLSQLRRAQLHSPRRVALNAYRMQAALSHEISQNADRRIQNADQLATLFFDRVRAEAAELDRASAHPVLQDLERRGIRDEDLEGDPWLADLNELLTYRGKLAVAAEHAGRDFSSLADRASMQRLPAWCIEQTLRKVRPNKRRSSGSDLNDRYLACLAPYAEQVYVDKRTFEDVRSSRRQSDKMTALLASIRRTVPFTEVFQGCPSRQKHRR